jgi:hypothetical protein
MKKIIAIAALLGIVLLVPMVLADQVNMNISVNGTADLNITVDADDTLAREMIAETQDDLYGSMTGSGPKDMVLDEIEAGVGNPITSTEGIDTIEELCYDPFLQQYLSDIGTLPPLEFVDYVKALGYDDEIHINLIWSVCQQLYMSQNENTWSTDSGLTLPDLVRYITGAVNWLMGKDANAPEGYKQMGVAMDSYFASDRDVWVLVNKINELEIRIQTLEKTMERIASDPYCEVKKEALLNYNLTYVKCGENSTIYARVNPEEFGYNIIGYTNDDDFHCEEDWVCTEWEECDIDKRTRTCADVNKCGTEENKPAETQACIIVQETVEMEKAEPEGEVISIKGVLPKLQSIMLPLFMV